MGNSASSGICVGGGSGGGIVSRTSGIDSRVMLLVADCSAVASVLGAIVPFSGGGSSFMHAFSSMLVHLPMRPPWKCLMC